MSDMIKLFEKNKETEHTLQFAIYKTLKEIILNEDIKNDFTENEIAKELNVSRTPVREAMQKLAADGLIEIFHGKKAQINFIKNTDVRDISLILQHLHSLSAELCIRNITDEEIEDLGETIDFIHFFTARKDYKKLVEYNTKFHLKICQYSKNRWLYNIMQNLLEFTFVQREKSISKSTRIIKARDEHTEIFLAIKSRNVDLVKELIELHVNSAYNKSVKEDAK